VVGKVADSSEVAFDKAKNKVSDVVETVSDKVEDLAKEGKNIAKKGKEKGEDAINKIEEDLAGNKDNKTKKG
jgi:hypothetical protein